MLEESNTPCASGSVVEYRLAKARVAGSNPVLRSKKRNRTVSMILSCFFRERKRSRPRDSKSSPLRSGPPNADIRRMSWALPARSVPEPRSTGPRGLLACRLGQSQNRGPPDLVGRLALTVPVMFSCFYCFNV